MVRALGFQPNDRDSSSRTGSKDYMPYKDKDRQREFCRIWTAQRRALWMEGKSCVICGSVDRLEIHHKDKSQKVSHSIWSWTEKRRNEELLKCEVRCWNCHQRMHHQERRRPAKHGTCAGYDRGCRCGLCRDHHIGRMRSWKLRTNYRGCSSMVEPGVANAQMSDHDRSSSPSCSCGSTVERVLGKDETSVQLTPSAP